MTAPSQPALVTGASGFIGSTLVRVLAESGWPVRALVRPGRAVAGGTDKAVRTVEGDILAPDTLARAMAGCTRVFHLAAYARNWARAPATFFAHNVLGTRNVLAAARAAGVERIVLTSTIVTFGPTPPGAVADETTARSDGRPFTAYEETKALAEREALAAGDAGAPVVVVNPTRVYGPGPLSEGNSVTVMIDLYARGRFPFLLAGGANVGNYAFVEDVARGHLLAMEHGRPGERYILGGHNSSLRGLLETVDRVSGERHRTVSLPAPLARLYAGVEELRARWLGGSPRITPGWVDTFLHDWAFSSAKAERELGYAVTPLADGLRATHQWLQAGGAKGGGTR
jgi:farnesol dehydrogenase